MRIPKGVFKISSIAAAENTRYAFAGVELKRLPDDKLVASATDGRRAIRVEWKEDRDQPVQGLEAADLPVEGFTAIVPAVDAKKADAAIPKGDRYPFVLLDEAGANGRLQMVSPGSATTVTVDSPAMEGLFPPVAEVVPSFEIIADHDDPEAATKKKKPKDRAVRIGVNGKLLAELLKTMVEAVPKDAGPIVVLEIPANPKRPIKLVRKGDDVDAVAVLMPVSIANGD